MEYSPPWGGRTFSATRFPGHRKASFGSRQSELRRQFTTSFLSFLQVWLVSLSSREMRALFVWQHLPYLYLGSSTDSSHSLGWAENQRRRCPGPEWYVEYASEIAGLYVLIHYSPGDASYCQCRQELFRSLRSG